MSVCMADSSLNSLRMVCLNERKTPLHDLGMVTWFVWSIVTLLLISRRWFVWIIVTLPLHNLDMACLHYCAVYPFKNWTWFVWIIVTSSLKHLDVVRLNSCDIVPQPWFFWIIVNLSPNAWKMACLSCGDVIPQSFGHGFSGLLLVQAPRVELPQPLQARPRSPHLHRPRAQLPGTSRPLGQTPRCKRFSSWCDENVPPRPERGAPARVTKSFGFVGPIGCL